MSGSACPRRTIRIFERRRDIVPNGCSVFFERAMLEQMELSARDSLPRSRESGVDAQLHAFMRKRRGAVAFTHVLHHVSQLKSIFRSEKRNFGKSARCLIPASHFFEFTAPTDPSRSARTNAPSLRRSPPPQLSLMPTPRLRALCGWPNGSGSASPHGCRELAAASSHGST
jgi:hypothetical protein